MTIIFIVLIILASVILSLIVLVQNPKGGGLTGNIAGFSNQFMGVKQTTDVLEKGTWIFAAVIAILCITSTMFISGGSDESNIENVGSGVPARPGNQQNTTTMPGTQTNDTNR
jgi:preprotein translocase subunit SecG